MSFSLVTAWILVSVFLLVYCLLCILSLSLWVPVSVFLVVYFLLYTLTLGLLGAGE